MFCKNCGNSFEGSICPNCGTQMTDPGKGLGVASLVLGICGLVFGILCPCLAACLGAILPLALSITGLILGILGKNKSAAAGFSNGPAKVGFILSIVALAITLIFGLIGWAFGVALAEELGYYY